MRRGRRCVQVERREMRLRYAALRNESMCSREWMEIDTESDLVQVRSSTNILRLLKIE